MALTIVVCIACFLVGGLGAYWLFRHGLRSKYEAILRDAETEAEMIKKNKLIEVKEKFLNKKAELEKEVAQRNQKIQQAENKLKQRELVLSQRHEEVQRKKRRSVRHSGIICRSLRIAMGMRLVNSISDAMRR